MRKTICVIVLAVAVTACTDHVTPIDTGGSRSDGVVKMSFEYKGRQKPIVDWHTAHQVALRRCRQWGYTRTEAFGGVVQQCQGSNQYGCNRWFVTRSYQCIR